jgi:RNA polymerase primary sigma factor
MDTNVESYFRQMGRHAVLTAEQEREAAYAIAALEVAYWNALLSHPPAFAVIARKVADHFDEPVPGLRALKRGGTRAIAKLAQTLRELDVDRSLVRTIDEAVHDLDDRDDAYLQRVEQARAAQADAKARFVAANLRLVVTVARRYARSHMPFIDLIQEGNLGLMTAVERFDPSRGFRFSTYATWWIRHAVARAVANHSRTVRLPVHVLDARRKVVRARQRMLARSGRRPTVATLAHETGLREGQVQVARAVSTAAAASLDRPINSEDGQTFGDLLCDDDARAPDEQVVAERWRQRVPDLLDSLSPMQSDILRCRFGLDGREEVTLSVLGRRYGLSRERIRQIQNEALDHLRKTPGLAAN